jgi:4-diphosphocytidyl-2-C-methyl-D-erythritol kinase
MLSFPHAKINIGLYITEKRTDGFHNLESCFYPIGWSDVLEIIPSTSTSLSISGLTVDGNLQDNLCIKAYELLKKDFWLPPVAIYLHKVIPMGAGLGGGSADAAFTIKNLNQLFSLGLTSTQMQRYASQLGSDCAFFVEGKPTFCYEKGDKFKPINLSLRGKYLVLIYPDVHISTKEAYSQVAPQKTMFDLREFLEKTPIEMWKETLRNDFERSLFPKYPQLDEIKSTLYQQGALYASMSGSGSAIYGIFKEKPVSLSFPYQVQIWQETL